MLHASQMQISDWMAGAAPHQRVSDTWRTPCLAQDYFIKFGYVMDVYLPRDKVNRSEHRGFGFVTFETEAAVQRIHSHGQHQIRCSPTPFPTCPLSLSVRAFPAAAGFIRCVGSHKHKVCAVSQYRYDTVHHTISVQPSTAHVTRIGCDLRRVLEAQPAACWGWRVLYGIPPVQQYCDGA